MKKRHNHPPRHQSQQPTSGPPPASATTPADKLLQQACAHHNAGQFAQAEALYRQVLQLSPNHPTALQFLSLLACQVGQNAIALDLADRTVQVSPSDAAAHFNRGNILFVLQRHRDAVESYDQALRLNPQHPEAHNNRGSAQHALKQYRAAVDSYDNAVRIKPDYVEAYCNRGNTLYALHQYKQAADSCDQAIHLRPDYAEAHYNRGNALQALERYPEAVASYDQAIRFRPDYAEAFSNRGNSLSRMQRHREAAESCDQAIRLKPDFADALCNRGNALLAIKQYPEALSSYNQAIRLQPDCAYAPGMRLHLRGLLCEWDHRELECRQLEARIDRNQKATAPFPTLALIGSPALQKKAAEIYVRDNHPAPADAAPIPLRPQRDKIRIGYFSADFYQHAVCAQMIDLFERHDHSRFEIIGFSFGPKIEDEMTRRASAAMDRFIDVRSLSDREVAELSRKLEVDIAVDLTGLTEHFRLGIFAPRAAPIQVNYLGYPGTAGADYIDYLIADSTLVPEASRQHYAEKIVYMPDSFQANSRNPTSEKQYTRSEQGLPEQGFVFCCFNNSYKIGPATFAVWMRILERVEGSVLWLLGGNPLAEANLRMQAAQHGIAPERLFFAQRLPLAEHLSRQRLADLFLDTLPFNAGATASPALWAGLPVLTCIGETFAGRMGASLLRAIDLPELITTTPAEYESLAVELALDPQRYHALRHRLQQNRLTTPLFDTTTFTRHLEAAYTAIFDRHRAGLPPDHIRVTRLPSARS